MKSLAQVKGILAFSFLFTLLLTLPAQAQTARAAGTPNLHSAPLLKPNAPSVESWASVGEGIQGVVRAIAVNGTDIYVGGDITAVCGSSDCISGNTNVNHIAKWDGFNWTSLGNGVNAPVNASVFIGNDLYVGGNFELLCGNAACDSGNTTAHHIAKWNGTSWTTLSNGVDNDVNALAVNGAELYAGGTFEVLCGNVACDSGNTTVNRIAKWNGTAWSASSNGVNGEVHALATVGDTVYAGGDFALACGNAACNSSNTTVNHLARWNGMTWSALASGVSDSVLAFAVGGTDVYIGGLFSGLCQDLSCTTTTNANHIAKWNGTGLTAVGNGLSGAPYALWLNEIGLYTGGEFNELCGNPACDSGNTPLNRIAKWNGAEWSSLDDGVSSTVQSIAAIPGGIILGGFFDYTCGNTACDSGNFTVNGLARYGDCMSAPLAPSLVAPAKNAQTTKTKVTLKWSASDCASTYNVIVKKTPGGTAYSASNLTRLQRKTSKLVKGKYKWTVEACNILGCAKSKAFKFTIQ